MKNISFFVSHLFFHFFFDFDLFFSISNRSNSIKSISYIDHSFIYSQYIFLKYIEKLMKTKKKTKEKKQNKWWQKKLFEIIFKFNLYTHIHTKKTASFSETLISLRYFCFLFFCFWFFSYLIQNSFIQHTHTHTTSNKHHHILLFLHQKKTKQFLEFFFSLSS